jgi:hypothetical protein
MRLQKVSLNVLQGETGLSRNTILRARRGQKVRTRSLRSLSKPIAGIVGAQLTVPPC